MADTLVERVTGQATAAAVPIEIQLVMPAETLLGQGSEPALAPATARSRCLRPSSGGRRVRQRRGRGLGAPAVHDAGRARPRDDGQPATPLQRSAAPPHRAPRPDLPHPLVRCAHPPRRPRHPGAARRCHVRGQRPGAVRGLQLRQGGAWLALHHPAKRTVAGRAARPAHTCAPPRPRGTPTTRPLRQFSPPAPPLVRLPRPVRWSTTSSSCWRPSSVLDPHAA